MKKLKIILMSLVGMGLLGAVFAVVLYFYLAAGLPELFSVEDYKPDLVSEVFARDGEKIGEFSTGEYRKLVPVEEIPENLKNAFISAEDSSFYQHNGFNFVGIVRAVIQNTLAGSRVQGASTITQQTARTLFLTSERTYTRKLKEAIMAQKMEANLSKDEILYLYLNQVYFGQRAYGVASAADTYFRKDMKEMTLAEMAMLGGLLTAPSRYNPVTNPGAAKTRQLYVLKRMLETERITQDQYDVATNETMTIYQKKKFKDVAPYFVETVRLLLNKEIGEEQVEKRGLQVFSSLDYKSQIEAQASVRKGLRNLDKRQGFRGPKRSLDITNDEEVSKFLSEVRDDKITEAIGKFELYADGSTSRLTDFKLFQEKDAKGVVVSNVPTYLEIGDTVEGVVTDVNSSKNVVFVKFAEAQGIIPLKAMEWARPRDLNKRYGEHLHIKSVEQALKKGDVVDVRIVAKTAKGLEAEFKNVDKTEYAELALEQEPEVEGALLSFDLKTDDIIAMVGGSNFRNTKYNRTYQTHRQTGSAIKPIIYAAGLDSGLTPATPIMGAPIVYTQEEAEMDAEEVQKKLAAKPSSESTSDNSKVWKPSNYGGRFSGDKLLRNCLKESQNTGTIRVMEKAGITFASDYAKRMGIFSPLNMDMSMALGSSGISLYEMTKVFSIFARMGKNIRPIIIHEVKSHEGDQLLQSVSFDLRFAEQLEGLKTYFEEKKEKVIAHQAAVEKAHAEAKNNDEGGDDPDLTRKEPKKSRWLSFFNSDPEQVISAQTAFLITNILQAAVNESGGTGVRAQRLGREVAGKTGTTDGYYDAWFMGFTPQVTTGVWVGFDQEKTLGPGESGGRAALPIWLEYMQGAMKDLPKMAFSAPSKIVFANIDNETGHIANSNSHEVVRQAFVEGTEPGQNTEAEILKQEEEDKTDFLREDF